MPRRPNSAPKVKCSAKSKRSQKRCQSWALLDKETGKVRNGKCAKHGGKSTGAPGNTNTLDHGFYSKALRADEREDWARVPIGGLDDEIRIARLQLRRAMTRRDEVLADIEFEEEQNVNGRIDGGFIDTSTQTKKLKDWDTVIDKQIGRIARLEDQRLGMKKKEAELDGEGSSGGRRVLDPEYASGAIQQSLRDAKKYASRTRSSDAQG